MRLLLAVLVTACASHAAAPSAPDYTPIATSPLPAHGALYTACIADAVAHGTVTTDRREQTLLLFTCTGAPAQAFYDGLATHAARIGSQFEHGGRTYRSTARVQHDLYGVDHCSTNGADYACTVTLNAGRFLVTGASPTS